MDHLAHKKLAKLEQKIIEIDKKVDRLLFLLTNA